MGGFKGRPRRGVLSIEKFDRYKTEVKERLKEGEILAL